MRNLIVFINTGLCGEHGVEAFQVADDATIDEIHEICFEMACQHAESFGHYFSYEDDEEENDDGWQSDWLDFHYEDYNPEVHDDERCGGGSFEDDFARMEKYNV